jgi:hypothetical protein
LPGTRQRNRRRIEFLEAATDAADRLGLRGEQRQALDHLSDMDFDPARDPDALARVYLLHGRYAVSTGQYGLARGMLRNAVELAQKGRAPVVLSEALRRLSAVQAHVGELRSARVGARALGRGARSTAVPGCNWAWSLAQATSGGAASRTARCAAAQAQHWNRGIAAGHMLRGRIYRARPFGARARLDAARSRSPSSGRRRLPWRRPRASAAAARPQPARRGRARLREALLIRGGSGVCDLPSAIFARVLTYGVLWRAGVRSGIGAELPDRTVVRRHARARAAHTERADEALPLVTSLRSRMRKENARLKDKTAQRSHRTATTRPLEAVLSSEGVIYPRRRRRRRLTGPETGTGPGALRRGNRGKLLWLRTPVTARPQAGQRSEPDSYFL